MLFTHIALSAGMLEARWNEATGRYLIESNIQILVNDHPDIQAAVRALTEEVSKFVENQRNAKDA